MLHLCLLLSAAGSLAELVTDSAAKAAVVLYEESQFTDAAAGLDEQLARRDLSASDRRYVGLAMAFSQLALGYEQAARQRLIAIVSEDPKITLPPMSSPKLRRFLDSIRAEVQLVPRVSALAPTVHPNPAGGPDVALRFQLDRPVTDMQGVVHHRRRGEKRFAAKPLHPQGDTLAARVTPQPPESGDLWLEYYAEISRGSRVLGTAGSALAPLAFRLAENELRPAPVSVTRRWWFWTIIAVVAAGAVAGGVSAYLLTREPAPAIVDVRFSGGMTR